MSTRAQTPRPASSSSEIPSSRTGFPSKVYTDTKPIKNLEDVQVVEVTDRNLNGYKWLNNDVSAIQFSDLTKPIKGKKLEGQTETLTLVEFKGGTTLENILTVLESCPNLDKVLFNGIQLESYPRSYGNHFTVMVKELVFFGHEKLTQDELHIISYFNKRINFPALQSLVFQSKKKENRTAAAAVVTGAETYSGTPEKDLSRKMYPPNDATNSVNTSVLSALMVKCAESLRSLEAKRKIFLMSPTDKTDVTSVQLERLVSDMNNTGFEKILNVQKNLRILICFNSAALPAHTFESVMVCVERCERTLTDIKIRHKFIFKNEFKNPLLGQTPSVVIHDCNIYAPCYKLRTLHLDFSSLSKQQQQQQQQQKRKKQVELEQEQQQQQQQQDIKAVSIIGLASIPFSLKLLTIRFDVIDDKEMSSFAQRFPHFHSLTRIILEGNPATPFLMKPLWISRLLQLPLLQLFQFHHYRIRKDEENSEAWRLLKGEIARIGNDSVLTSNTCICRRSLHNSPNKEKEEEK